MTVLLTGAAGFIGAYVARGLLARGESVVGVDDFKDYYDPQLKRYRVSALCRGLDLRTVDIADKPALDAIFAQNKITYVVHLAAQAGVRYSLKNPYAYLHSNLTGFLNILEGCRRYNVRHLAYASSSSVYGGNAVAPFAETQKIDEPLSLYAATKASNELMAHSYAHLYRIPCTGLRFFTVYGPWGRPDMAPLIFSRAILAGRPIDVFNRGRMRRDFTYVDDIVGGVISALANAPKDDGKHAPYAVYNLGNHRPVELERFIAVIELSAGRKAERVNKPMQPGDMLETSAAVERAQAAFGFSPSTTIEQGMPKVVAWCREYFGDKL